MKNRVGVTESQVVVPVITAVQYSAGDAVGGKLTFTGLFKSIYGGGVQVSMLVADKAKQNSPLTLVLFNQDFTATANHAAFAPSDADLLNIIGVVPVIAADYYSFNDNSVGIGTAFIPLKSVTTSGTIYGQLYTTDAPTYSVGDLQIRLSVITDLW